MSLEASASGKQILAVSLWIFLSVDLETHPRALSKYFCLYESEEAELHFGVGANS